LQEKKKSNNMYERAPKEKTKDEKLPGLFKHRLFNYPYKQSRAQNQRITSATLSAYSLDCGTGLGGKKEKVSSK